MEKRQSARARGYIHAVIESEAGGRATGHVMDLSRHGALISTEKRLANGTPLRIHIDVDRKFEEATGAPDVIVLTGVVVDDSIEENVAADHYRIAFTGDTVMQWWPYIDALISAYRMRYSPTRPPLPRAP